MPSSAAFARSLVKGRIAETVFAQMYRDTGRYTVLEFGYEKVIPELVQGGYTENSGIIETLRTAPDFAVIEVPHKHVRLVEVKYRSRLDETEVLATAQRMHKSWNPSYLFIATKAGFYFDEISDIIANAGAIRRLTENNVSYETQQNYLSIIHEFEKQ